MKKTKEDFAKSRLNYLRKEIRAERISYGEIAELQSLAKYIKDGDIELLEWAGIPEKGVSQGRIGNVFKSVKKGETK